MRNIKERNKLTQGYKLEKSPSMIFIYDYHAFYQISKCTGENSMTLLSSETLTMVQKKISIGTLTTVRMMEAHKREEEY